MLWKVHDASNDGKVSAPQVKCAKRTSRGVTLSVQCIDDDTWFTYAHRSDRSSADSMSIHACRQNEPNAPQLRRQLWLGWGPTARVAGRWQVQAADRHRRHPHTGSAGCRAGYTHSRGIGAQSFDYGSVIRKPSHIGQQIRPQAVKVVSPGLCCRTSRAPSCRRHSSLPKSKQIWSPQPPTESTPLHRPSTSTATAVSPAQWPMLKGRSHVDVSRLPFLQLSRHRVLLPNGRLRAGRPHSHRRFRKTFLSCARRFSRFRAVRQSIDGRQPACFLAGMSTGILFQDDHNDAATTCGYRCSRAVRAVGLDSAGHQGCLLAMQTRRQWFAASSSSVDCL